MYSKKTNIAFIGAGKIAYSLISALKANHYNVTSVISKNINSAKKLAVKFKIKNYSNNLEDIPQNVKIIFLSVPDSKIEITAKKIARLNLNIKNKLFIHLSGSLNIDSLKSLSKRKAKTASFHIMQTFPSKEIVEIQESYTAVEINDDRSFSYLFRLAENLKLKPFKLNSGSKVYYHLAGVFAANFLTGNLYSSDKVFRNTKTKNVNVLEVMKPIIETTLHNINKKGISNSLSGPIERGDYLTVKNHIKAIKKDNSLLLNYLIQSLNLLDICKKKSRNLNGDYIKLNNLLKDELKNCIKKLK